MAPKEFGPWCVLLSIAATSALAREALSDAQVRDAITRREPHAIWQRDIHARALTMSLATAQAAERVAPTVDRAARLRSAIILQTSARKGSQGRSGVPSGSSNLRGIR
jgi:hypothetical protein